MRMPLFVTSLACFVLIACSSGPDIKVGPMPSEGRWSGVYFSQQYGEMHMIANGNAVVCEYAKDERVGKIQGEAEGDVLRFEWEENRGLISNRRTVARGHGYFKYIVDPDNGEHFLKGRWGLDEDSSNGGEWIAYKSRDREPQMSTDSNSGGDSGGGSDELFDDEGEGDSSGGGDDDELF